MTMNKDLIINHFKKAYYEGANGDDIEFLLSPVADAIKDWASRNYGGAQYDVVVKWLNEHFGIYEEEEQ